jgi:hypothetical protein
MAGNEVARKRVRTESRRKRRRWEGIAEQTTFLFHKKMCEREIKGRIEVRKSKHVDFEDEGCCRQTMLDEKTTRAYSQSPKRVFERVGSSRTVESVPVETEEIKEDKASASGDGDRPRGRSEEIFARCSNETTRRRRVSACS